jgi:putative endo alpha-1,4 polygalactosaminidase
MIPRHLKALSAAAVVGLSVAACSASTPDTAPAPQSTTASAAATSASTPASPTSSASSATASASAEPTIIAALPSASRWGHYGAPGNVDVASDAAGWSPQEQQAATDFAVQTMRVFAMDTDAATWHRYMDERVTDDYRQQLARFNPSLNPVHEVKNAVYGEFPSDPTRAVVRVATNDGVWVVQLRRSGPGEAPKVANISPLSVKKH